MPVHDADDDARWDRLKLFRLMFIVKQTAMANTDTTWPRDFSAHDDVNVMMMTTPPLTRSTMTTLPLMTTSM